MGDSKQQSARQELEALHAALVRQRREAGLLDATIPMAEWESILARTLNVMTRQTAADKTWAMHRLGFIHWEKKVGIRVVDPAFQAPVEAHFPVAGASPA